MTRVDYTEVDALLSTNPKAGWKDFRKAYPDSIVLEGSFYARKRKMKTTKSRRSKNSERIQQVLSLLSQNEKGMPSDDIAEALKIQQSSVHSLIYKMKKDGHPIKRKGSNYVLEGANGNTVTSLVPTPSSSVVPSLPEQKFALKNEMKMPTKQTLNEISRWDETDQNDWLDAMKRGFFYFGSANALLQANRMQEDLRKEIRGM